MSVEHLVQMANDIGHFFAAEPRREDAIAGIVNHIGRFWDPRMRRQIEKHLSEGGEGLEELVREAVARLSAPATT
jgi:formate dehydrogenase subunit delta